jgi:hypothetical protein
MKKTFVIFAAFCIMSMGACFSPWDGSGQGIIVINLENGGVRTLANGDKYTVILTNSDGTTIRKEIIGGKTKFLVQPGPWNILVNQYTVFGGNDVLEQFGETYVEVKAGAIVDALIELGDLDWSDLGKVIEKAGENESVMLTKDLEVKSYIQIPKGKNITFLAQVPVIIKKANDGNFDNSMFRVPSNSSLTLGVGGMSGTITFDGNKEKYMTKSSSSLIYVGDQRIINGKHIREGNGGTLTIYDNVTLTNNRANITTNDRGGAVVVDGGIFRMYGGIISGNTNTDKGGGVRVLSGTFTKNGGTIYGNDRVEEKLKNTAQEGCAVYFDKASKKSYDDTLWPENGL